MPNQNGRSKQIMFVMFPVFGVPKKDGIVILTKTKNQNKLHKRIKKICSIYFHEPLYYNINYYSDSEQLKYLYNKNIEFTKENFDVIKECDKIYQNIKDFTGLFVLNGHSIKSYFIYCFFSKIFIKVPF